jgi:hypothetical protein
MYKRNTPEAQMISQYLRILLNLKTYFIALLFPALLLFSCKGNGQHQSVSDEQNIAKNRMDSLHNIAMQTAKTYHEMNESELERKLLEQSKQKKEPFNSLAYRELITRKEVDPNPMIIMVRDNANADGMLPLLLLRKINYSAYLKLPMSQRIAVLTNALETSKYFNSWGIPPFYLQDASSAMLECDSTAFPSLRKILGDTRPAPVFGSQEYMLYQRYQYRVCDYALFFLRAMQTSNVNRKIEMPVSAAGRDSLIRAIK